MDPKLFKTYDLENGLKLELHDACRKLIGDRWQLKFIARVNVPVEQVLSESSLNLPAEISAIRSAVGETVQFEQSRERNFIDDAEKEALFRELCDAYSESSKPYLGHADFGPRLVLKTYREWEQKHTYASMS
jgi:hypothetical protein